MTWLALQLAVAPLSAPTQPITATATVGKAHIRALENNKRKNIYSIPYPQKFRPIVEGLSEEELSRKYLQVLEDTITQIQADGIGFAGILLPDICQRRATRNSCRVYASGNPNGTRCRRTGDN